MELLKLEKIFFLILKSETENALTKIPPPPKLFTETETHFFSIDVIPLGQIPTTE